MTKNAKISVGIITFGLLILIVIFAQETRSEYSTRSSSGFLSSTLKNSKKNGITAE